MSGLIVSYLIFDRHSDPYGFRVFADGRVESYQVSRTVKTDDGQFEQESLTPDWYPLTTLDEAQLQQVKTAVDESGMAQMPVEIQESGESTSSNDASAEWQMGTDNDVMTISVGHWVPDSPHGEALLKLEGRLMDIIETAT